MKKPSIIKAILLSLLLAASGFCGVSVGPIQLPKPQFFDNNGIPLSLGFVCTYQAGTSTPLATYIDSTGTTQNANPVPLDASGRPSSTQIWLGPAAYKIVLQGPDGASCAGTVIWTTDNVMSFGSYLSLSGGTVIGNVTVNGNLTVSGSLSFGTILGSFPVSDKGGQVYNVKAYGAVGDGVTDDTTAVQLAITAAKTNKGGTVYFPASPNCYVFASSLNLTNLHGIVFRGAGIQGVGGVTGGAIGSSLCSSAVLANTPAFDFSGDTYVRFVDLGFTFVGSGFAPVTVYGQRTATHGFCEDIVFDHVSIARPASGSPVADFMSNNCEVIDFYDPYIDTNSVGVLLSFGQTHGVASSIGDLSVNGSMTQVSFHGGKIVGSGINVMLDATGGVISDVSFHGTFFANSGASPIGFDLIGTVWTPQIFGARYELSSTSGTVSFIKAEAGATLIDTVVSGFDCGGAASICYGLYSTAAANVRNAKFDGVYFPINWNGNLYSTKVLDGNLINVTQTNGDILNSSFETWAANGGGTFGSFIANFTYGGNLFADIGSWKNVTCIQAITGAGTKTCTLSTGTITEDRILATFNHDYCEGHLNFTGGAFGWVKDYTIAGGGTLTCPVSGAITQIQATYNGVGDFFIIQKFGR